jgi:hypothetical protein
MQIELRCEGHQVLVPGSFETEPDEAPALAGRAATLRSSAGWRTPLTYQAHAMIESGGGDGSGMTSAAGRRLRDLMVGR